MTRGTARWALIILLLLATVVTAGCAGLIAEPQEPTRLHDLGPQGETAADTPALRIERIRGPTWLETDRIHYRQLHEDPTRLQHYARNRWLATPAELIARRLTAAFADAAERDSPSLQGELLTFEQRFHEEEHSEAVLRFRAALAQDGRVLATETFHISEPTEPGVRGAIQGLAQATATLEEQVAAWASRVAERQNNGRSAITERDRR